MEEPQKLTVEQIFDRVMQSRKLNKKQFAAYLKLDGSVMSSKLGAKWNLHWRIFVQLLPDLVALRIIHPNQLIATSDKEGPDGGGSRGDKSTKSQEKQPEKPPPTHNIMETGNEIPYLLH